MAHFEVYDDEASDKALLSNIVYAMPHQIGIIYSFIIFDCGIEL